MIDVEQRPLRAFEQHRAAARDLVRERLRRVPDVRLHALAELQRPVEQRRQLQLLAPQRGDLRVGLVEPRGELGLERLRLAQIAHADPAPRHLVLVARPDAAAGGADRFFLLAAGVDPLVVRQDDVGVLAHHQLRRVGEQPAAFQHVDLFHQRFRVDHHAVADDALLPRMENARRHQVQHRLHAAHHQRVAGVGAALVADDDVGPRGEEVDDLPLPLVAPLRADDDDIRHTLT